MSANPKGHRKYMGVSRFLRKIPLPSGVLEGLPQSSTFLDKARSTLALATKKDGEYQTHYRRLKTQLDTLKRELNQEAPKSIFIVDLTNPKTQVTYGWNIDKQMSIVSAAKLAALYAAFQLREDVRALCTWGGIKNSKNLLSELRKAWAKAPDPDIQALAKLPTKSLPQLRAIFDFASFDSGSDPLPQFKSVAKLSAFLGKYDSLYFERLLMLHLHNCPEVRTARNSKFYDLCYEERFNMLSEEPFNELLHLMARWSDNEAATACIAYLGLPFIQAIMRHRGLYTDKEGGLWLNGVYRGQIGKSFRRVSLLPDPKTGNKVRPTQGGTAESLGMLFAALAMGDLLVDGATQLRAMIDFSPELINSAPVLPGNYYLFKKQGNLLKTYETKIGFIERKHYSEAAYVTMKVIPKSYSKTIVPFPERSFVCVALHANSFDALTSFGEKVFQIIDEINPK